MGLLLGLLAGKQLEAQTQIILVRHGQTQWNQENRYQGHTDIPLNEKGQRQAEQLAEEIVKVYPGVKAIYASDLQRAYGTALPTADKLGLEVVKKSGLREMNWGELEGAILDEATVARVQEREQELKALYSDRKERWDVALVEGAETFNQLLGRMAQELFEIAEKHPDETVLVFTHGRAMRVIMMDILDREDIPSLSNCSLVHISVDLENEQQPLSYLKVEKLI